MTHDTSTCNTLQAFLQRNLALGLPVAWGRWGTLVPLAHKPIVIEVGAPVNYTPSTTDLSLQDQIDEYHALVVKAMVRLFERTKHSHGEGNKMLIVD